LGKGQIYSAFQTGQVLPNEGAFLNHDWQAFKGVFAVQMEIGVIWMSEHGYDS
jgi:hypothetical protein